MSASRALLFGVFALCAALLGFGFYLQYARDLEPCPLCLVQRLFFVLAGGTALLGALHDPRRWGRRIYGAGLLLWSLGGLAAAGRQVWLQRLPADQVPECGPDLAFMLEVYPLTEMLAMLFRGSGQCAEVVWTFLGFSIPEWSLLCFAGLTVLGAWLLLRRTETSRPAGGSLQ